MAGLNVLIIGASIAGPSAAYWLAKAGAKVTIIERFPDLRRGGQAVDIRTSGVSVMRKIPGMEEKVRAKSTQEEGLSLVDENGESYGVIRASGNPDQQSILSEYEIFRGDLSKILFDMTNENENIKYVFGEQIAAMSHQDVTQEGAITVEFANGRLPSASYDLVVACDGATSRTRALGLQCGVRSHVFSTNWWAAYFTVRRDLLQGSRISQGYSAVGGRFINLSSDPDTGHTRVMLMSNNYQDKGGSALPFREAQSQGEETLKKYIMKHYQGVGWVTQSVLQEMEPADDFYASEILQVKIPEKLYNGRFVLVGDAGYAAGPTGGGTSLALTGAYILAGEVSKHPGDLVAALKGYQQKMRPIITELQKIPPLVGTFMAPQTAWGIWIRNRIWALVAWAKIAELAQSWMGAAFSSTDKFPLPEYEWLS